MGGVEVEGGGELPKSKKESCEIMGGGGPRLGEGSMIGGGGAVNGSGNGETRIGEEGAAPLLRKGLRNGEILKKDESGIGA